MASLAIHAETQLASKQASKVAQVTEKL
jgi:hypothetical protein